MPLALHTLGQLLQPFLLLLAPLAQRFETAQGGAVFGVQGGLAPLRLVELGAQLVQLLAQFGFAPPAGHQAVPQFQQAAPQGLGLIAFAAAAKAELAAPLLQAAAGHGAALLEQLAIEGHGPAAAQFAAGTAQVAEHQRVAEDVAEHLGVNRFVVDQLHGPAHQTGGPSPSPLQCGTGSPATAPAADLVEGQEGESPRPAAFEQVDGPGGDAVVIDHHLAQAPARRHLQRHPMGFLHLAQLGHRAVDALQPGFQQHP